VVLTISEDLRASIAGRGVVKREISIIENPALVTQVSYSQKKEGLVFCGNAGRLQVMEEVLSAVERFYQQGGKLEIAFVGGGVFKEKIKFLDKKFANFSYFGKVSGREALEITARYTWGLLPINPEVLRYGYPSKIPTYLSAGCHLLCVTGARSTLARWITDGGFGIVKEPVIDEIVTGLFDVERRTSLASPAHRQAFLDPEEFAHELNEVVLDVIEGRT
jgi:hypothetical protein